MQPWHRLTDESLQCPRKQHNDLQVGKSNEGKDCRFSRMCFEVSAHTSGSRESIYILIEDMMRFYEQVPRA